MSTRPYVLSIAGFDPSSGAGITADVKAFEQNGVYGLGVCSAITYQNGSEFEGLDWVPVENIIRQAGMLFPKYPVAYAKIGLIENLEVLQQLVTWLKTKSVKIVWDPILKASAGYSLHKDWNSLLLQSILADIYLVTPNMPEFGFLCTLLEIQSPVDFILKTQLNALLLKGGHSRGIECSDVLYAEGKEFSITGERIEGAAKHGTGCVLSAAIVSQLALGDELLQACVNAKIYVEKLIRSNNHLLGYHT